MRLADKMPNLPFRLLSRCAQLVLLSILGRTTSSETPGPFNVADWRFCSENCLEFDHSKWQLVLDTALNSTSNFLRYRDVPRDELQSYLGQLRSPDISSGRYSSDELWAILANAYNALVVNTVIQNDIQDSIIAPWGHDVWKRPAGVVGGQEVHLDNIEHDLLRKLWKEPRVHSAVVCAAKSCVPLRAEAYRGSTLEEQLEDQMRKWLAMPHKGLRYDQEAHAVYLSKIFSWYLEDFAEDTNGLLAYLAPYVDSNVATQLLKQPPPTVHFMEYDWSLNDEQVPAQQSAEAGVSNPARALDLWLIPALGVFLFF